MLLANVSWGLMSPIAKIVMAGGLVTPLVLSDLRIFGAMILFWIVSLFRKPVHVASRDMFKLFGASLLAIVFNQGCFIFGVGLTSPKMKHPWLKTMARSDAPKSFIRSRGGTCSGF